MAETILIVDDEETVRRTFTDWLQRGQLGATVLAAADAGAALQLANDHTIDLAILDWNLGAGQDGLQLLEDLYEFNPDVVAILVTGFASQATPLEALRLGVRDYLDKSHDLNRETFLAATRKQLDRITPAKRQRLLTAELTAFRATLQQVLPLVEASAALNDPVPLPQAAAGLLALAQRVTDAAGGALIVRHAAANVYAAYGSDGAQLPGPLAPFEQSLAAAALSMGEVVTVTAPTDEPLQPFERGRTAVLAAPLNVGGGVQAVLELFDKANGAAFTTADKLLAAAAGTLGADLLKQALAERQTGRTLVEAVASALRAGEHLAERFAGSADEQLAQPTSPQVMEELRRGLASAPGAVADAGVSLKLAEAVRLLAVRHGPIAVTRCTELIEGVGRLLDEVTGG